MSALFRTVAASTKRPEAATGIAGVLVVNTPNTVMTLNSLKQS
jgi:hypothetical protein